MKVRYLTGWIALTLGVFSVHVSHSYPTSRSQSQIHSHEGFWSNDKFIDTLGDYLTSAENLKRSKSIAGSGQPVMSALSSEFVRQIGHHQGGYIYDQYQEDPMSSQGSDTWAQYQYPNTSPSEQGSRVIRYRDVDVGESQHSYAKSQVTQVKSQEAPLKAKSRKPHEVLVFHLPPEFTKKPPTVVTTKQPHPQQRKEVKQGKRVTTTTTEEPFDDNYDDDLGDEYEDAPEDQSPQQSISSHSHLQNFNAGATQAPTSAPQIHSSIPVFSHPVPTQKTHAPQQGQPQGQFAVAPQQGQPQGQLAPQPAQPQAQFAPQQGQPQGQFAVAPQQGQPQGQFAPQQGQPQSQLAPQQRRPQGQFAPLGQFAPEQVPPTGRFGPQEGRAHPAGPYQQQEEQQLRPQSQLVSPSVLIATTGPVTIAPAPYSGLSDEGYGENEIEKPQGLMDTLGSWMETGRKIMYFPRGVVDVIDKAMTYAEGNPAVGFVMDTMADKLFGSTKGVLHPQQQQQQQFVQEQQIEVPQQV